MKYDSTASFPDSFLDSSSLVNRFTLRNAVWVDGFAPLLMSARCLVAVQLGPRFDIELEARMRQLFECSLVFSAKLGAEFVPERDDRVDVGQVIAEGQSFCRLSSYAAYMSQKAASVPRPNLKQLDFPGLYEGLVNGLTSDIPIYHPYDLIWRDSSHPACVFLGDLIEVKEIKRVANWILGELTSIDQMITRCEAETQCECDGFVHEILWHLAHCFASVMRGGQRHKMNISNETMDRVWSAHDYVSYAQTRLMVFALRSMNIVHDDMQKETSALWESMVPVYKEFMGEVPWWAS